jgi:molybdate transport system substrate-binding protein
MFSGLTCRVRRLGCRPTDGALGARPTVPERRFPGITKPDINAEPKGCGRWRAAMTLRRHLLGSLIAAGLAAALVLPAAALEKSITVFAAASMKNALDDINAAFTKATGVKVVTSYAASSALARQIEQGAPADIFASADLEWMDYSSGKKTIKDDTRVNLLGNKLVVIAPKDSRITEVKVGAGPELATAIGDGRIATGEVNSVPAGKYAKSALEKLGIWSSVEKRFAMADHVRAAMALVSRGEAVLGIVYETDAKVDKSVKIVGAFPADSHAPITYPVAATVNAKPEAAAYLNFLRSQIAKAVFEQYGFTFLIRPTS